MPASFTRQLFKDRTDGPAKGQTRQNCLQAWEAGNLAKTSSVCCRG